MSNIKKSGCRGCKYRKVDEDKPLTNGDRIRAMTDEELAEWFDLHGECNQCAYHPAQCKTECNEGHLKWLKQEVSEDAYRSKQNPND